MTGEQEVLSAAALALLYIEKPKRFIGTWKHHSNFLLQMHEQELKRGDRKVSLALALQLSLFDRSAFFGLVSLCLLSVKFLSKEINNFVELLQIKNSTAAVICRWILILLEVNGRLLGRRQLSRSVEHQKFKKYLLVWSCHPNVDMAIQVFEILARNRITPAGVVPLGTEPERVQNLGVQVVLLDLGDDRLH